MYTRYNAGNTWIGVKSLFGLTSSKSLFSKLLSGASQNDPMYTRHTSGVCITFPRDHINAPYTRMSCWVSIVSALFSNTLFGLEKQHQSHVAPIRPAIDV